MHRGARRAPVFVTREDNQAFLDTLAEMVDRFCIEIHAYSLMPNHYHLLVHSVQGNLSKGMQYQNGRFTLWLNARHHWDGPVFRGRFHSQLITEEEHLRYLIAYIHLNPIEAHLARRLSDDAWTSHRSYLGLDEAPSWLTTSVFLDLFSGAEGLNDFVRSVRRGAVEYPSDFNPETGLFGRKIIEEPVKLRPARKAGRPPGKFERSSSHRLRPADEVLADVLAITGVKRADLDKQIRGPRANPARRFAVWALNRSSELSQREIGALLGASYAQVISLLGRLRRGKVQEPLRTWMERWIVSEEQRQADQSPGND
ncbi:MAG: transposase [Deltaproteobacteria bacterium]|nr:transposase [Deltaproteobacteria bacterium]